MMAIAGVVLCCSRAFAQTTTPATLHVHSGAREVALTAAEIAALPHRKLRVAGENSSDSSAVSGVTLWDILQKAGVPSTEASGRQRGAMYVRLLGSDGQAAMFGLAELDPGFSHRTVLVADQREGKPLDAAEGAWRVFVPDDIRHARWIRGLVRIDAGTLPPP
jgi:hypothetical protein